MVIAGEVARMVARGWADLVVAVWALALTVELFEGILVRFADLFLTLTKAARMERGERGSVVQALLYFVLFLDCDDREWSPKWIKFSLVFSGVKQTCQKVIVMVSKY